ncbi:hypothetical protein JCM19233_1943 [Vibrio astriarenae]|nr:hypothetical protein JCM19233_1943 [Vibrio sp. C7]
MTFDNGDNLLIEHSGEGGALFVEEPFANGGTIEISKVFSRNHKTVRDLLFRRKSEKQKAGFRQMIYEPDKGYDDLIQQISDSWVNHSESTLAEYSSALSGGASTTNPKYNTTNTVNAEHTELTSFINMLLA